MTGVIRNWDILSHPIVTIQCFGWRIFFRAVFSRQEKSFLSLLQDVHFFGMVSSKVPPLVDRCIELELRAMHIYRVFAKAFAKMGSAWQFFEALARQEQEHANLLELCRMAASRGGWKLNYFNPWQEFIPRLERQMKESEVSVYNIGTLDEALRLVVQIESSEINQVFQAVLAASDSSFVKKLKPFQKAMEMHMIYITEWLPELAPHMMMVSRELRAKFPRVRE